LKFLKILSKVFVFIVGALITLWILAPWGKIGEYAVLSAENVARNRGLTAHHASVDGSWIGPNIKVNNFVAKMVLGGGEFRTISVSPLFIKSIIQFSPVVSVSFTGGKLLYMGNDADMGAGSFELLLKNNILSVRNLKSVGELSFDGFIQVNIRDFAIENADLMIKPPEKIESHLGSMKMMVPSLIQETTGQWRIKKEKSNE
jgi:hypothetical protein